MGLSATIASAVAVANSVTADLQDNVTHEAWTGQDGTTKPTFAAGVARPALIEMEPALGASGAIRSPQGEVLAVRAKLTFLGPITGNGAANRTEPIDKRDRFTLPDGTTGPVLQVAGMIDPNTDKPYLTEVLLGY